MRSVVAGSAVDDSRSDLLNERRSAQRLDGVATNPCVLRAGERLEARPGRGADERETATIEGAHWIPLDELEARIGELIPVKDAPLVVHCHHGGRSEKAVRLLLERGFSQAENLDGGIEAWSLTVDPSIPRY